MRSIHREKLPHYMTTASLFPGMSPHLENSELWPAVHNPLIVAIADELLEDVSEKFHVVEPTTS